MAVNKNALLRYQTLDKCFSNFGKKYYFDDLLEIVNEALLYDNPKSTGVQVRQLREDIKFMKSESGYNAPIETFKEGKKPYYRYDDKNYSINNSPLNSTEAEQLKNAISVLQRFEGAPGFEWVSEIGTMMTSQFSLKESNHKVMAFESNIDYTGYEYISPLFNAIINKTVLKITYEPFNKPSFQLTFHPYYLKQYNNRWFVFGRNEEYDLNQWNLALDRIKCIEDADTKYIENDMDWEDFFYDIIGVSKSEKGKVEEVKLLFTKDQAPYIQTKPIHPSQKSTILEDGSLEVKIKVELNYELEMKILSYGEKVTVLEPIELINKIKNRVKQTLDKYN
jgi:predicted DNA-binding transcriptional regulator YafY